MDQENIRKQLSEPFATTEIEWKIQATTQDKTRGLAVAYLNSRAIQRRLDEVVGPFNWQNTYIAWQEKSQICGLSIFNAERGEWVTKYDGAENTDYEPVKGGLSYALKRAAVLWGVGRYLSEIEGVWVEIEQRGKSYAIKNDQYGRLGTDYMKALKKIFPDRLNQTGTSPASTGKSNPPPAPVKTDKESAPAAGKEEMPIVPTELSDFEFKVISVKPSGKTSQLLELVDGNGELITAYAKKSSDQIVTVGTCLRNVSMESKEGNYGQYNLISTFELAA